MTTLNIEELIALADAYALQSFNLACDVSDSEDKDESRQALMDALTAQAERIKGLEAEVAATKQQAQIWKMEADTQKATVREIYQLCTVSTGEPGDWSGANPVREVVAERDTLRAQLAALQSDDELPELGRHDHPEPRSMMWSDVEMSAIKAYARQAQSMVRAKMVPLTGAFAAAYWKACRSCMPDDWLEAALIAQQILKTEDPRGITGEPK